MSIMIFAAQIATSYLATHPMPASEAPKAVQAVAETMAQLAATAPQAYRPDHRARQRPDLPKKMGRPRRAETTECLHCNRRFRDLGQHVWKEHGMSMERYAKWFTIQ